QVIRLWDLRGKAPRPQATARLPENFWGCRILFDPLGAHLLLLGTTRGGEEDRLSSVGLIVWPFDATASELKNERMYRLGKPDRDPTKVAARRLAFSPDGRRMAVLMREELRLWDRPGQVLKERDVLLPHTDPCGLAFSPDGREVVTCGADQEGGEALQEVYHVRLWVLEGDRLKGKASFEAKVA